nr:unnamed protein product [Callosobruchus chinensis]
MKELQFVHARFYEIPSKLKQDAFILKCFNAILPKRRRREQREEGSTAYQKQVSIGYRIPKQGGEWIRICRSAFMKILDLKKDRIQGVVKRFFFEGQTPSENRGGDRVLGKNDKKKLAMSNFMESFKCVETHYCRSQVTRRTYLPCELNIRKLHKLYIRSVEPSLTVKEHYFRSYFTTHYNIGFGTPITDACSVCLRHKENIKKEKDDERKNELNILQELHKLKAKAFYKMLKANRKEREGTSNAKLNPETVTAYVWTDLDLPKNSSVIASALFHKLSNHNFSEKIKEMFIFADGCPGQNKNITVIGMLASFLHSKAPSNIQRIELIFPIVGHSFMPPDRVFGLFERHIKKKEVITNPEEYVKIIEQNAKVLKLTKDWDAFDWKTAVSQVLKPPGACHFQFQQCKRFIILKRNGTIEVQGEVNYHSDTSVSKGICKKGKKIHMINPDLIEPGRISDKKKAHSVSKLLQEHYGPDWQTKSDLKFYKDAINFSLHNDESDPQLLLNELCTEFPPEEATGMLSVLFLTNY